ncbi:hypothetical protein HK101_002524 [Irineochytrium annulatum]|nr:hypothetical protein HK101_002524 [Irineochytrium annulatum]
MTFNFPGGVSVDVSAEEYVVVPPVGSGISACIVALTGTADGSSTFILGNTLLKRWYTVFDYGNKRIGFTLAKGRKVKGGTVAAGPSVPAGATAPVASTAAGGVGTVALGSGGATVVATPDASTVVMPAMPGMTQPGGGGGGGDGAVASSSAPAGAGSGGAIITAAPGGAVTPVTDMTSAIVTGNVKLSGAVGVRGKCGIMVWAAMVALALMP